MSALYYRWISKKLVVVAAYSMAATFAPPVKAEKLSAGVVMEKMREGERYSFVAGIVEGLSIARYAQDGKKPDGMNCISDWFYSDPKALDNIYAAFGRFRDYPPGSVVDALARKKCP